MNGVNLLILLLVTFPLLLNCVTSAACCLFEQSSSCSWCISGRLPSRWWLLFCDFLFCFKQAQETVLKKTLSTAYRLFGTNWRLFFILVEVRGLRFPLRPHNPWYHANVSARQETEKLSKNSRLPLQCPWQSWEQITRSLNFVPAWGMVWRGRAVVATHQQEQA